MCHAPHDRPCVKLDDVTLRLGDTLMFERANWEIRSNQHWAIIGPTGTGKSILANALRRKVAVTHGRILYYFDQAQSGEITPRSYLKRGEVVGVSNETQRDLLRACGGYHQARWQSFEGRDAPTVSDVLTGKNIEHISPYEISPLQTDEWEYQQRRDHAVALLGIDYLLPRKILHLSHGEGRKVILARALMQRPRLLVLDDPFCGLDSESRRRLLDIITRIIALNACRVVLVVARQEHIPDNITHIARIRDHHIAATMPRAELTPLCAPSEKPPLLQKDGGDQQKAAKPSLLPLSFQERGPGGEFRAPGPPLIEMHDVSVSYGDVQVLRHLTWRMLTGEHWAVYGENGAGKTTLLSLILADNPRAYANNITLFGRRRGSGESIWDIKRRIGWVSPELHLYHQPGTRCAAVVESGFFDTVGLYRRASAQQADYAHSRLEAFGIDHLAELAFGSVSTGEQRLVLLARALVKAPDLLILDEPCQGLDQRHREQIIATLDQLCAQTAVHLIYVTHYRREMPSAISHMLHLAHGRIHRILAGKEIFL